MLVTAIETDRRSTKKGCPLTEDLSVQNYIG